MPRPETVYVCSNSHGGGRYFHEDEDCQKLDASKNVYEKERSVLPEDAKPCSACCSQPELEVVDLTSFQQYVLLILAEEARYGLAVKDELEDLYDQEITHGRLYPNLGTLVERGFVEKSALDERTNEYALTERGREALIAEARWRVDHLKAGQESTETERDEEAVAVADGGRDE